MMAPDSARRTFRRQLRSGVIATFLAVILFHSSVAWATDARRTATMGGPAIPGLTAEQQKNCGQDCMYKRANENTLLQAQTIINELIILNTYPHRVDETLKEFCTINNTSGAACFQLYKSAQIRHLHNLRGNIAQHSDMAARLNTFLNNPDAQIEFAAGGDGSTTPITPYTPTLKELGADPSAGTQNNPAQQRVDKYRAWVQSLSKPLDKNDPAFQESESLKSNRDESVTYYRLTPGKTNEKALKSAEEYAKKNEADLSNLQKNAENVGQLQVQMTAAIKSEEDIDAQENDPGMRMKLKTGEVREAAYGETRQIIIDAALGTKSQSAEANAKTGSGTPPAPATTTPLYDQTLQQQAKTNGVAQPKNFVLPNVEAIDAEIYQFEQ